MKSSPLNKLSKLSVYAAALMLLFSVLASTALGQQPSPSPSATFDSFTAPTPGIKKLKDSLEGSFTLKGSAISTNSTSRTYYWVVLEGTDFYGNDVACQVAKGSVAPIPGSTNTAVTQQQNFAGKIPNDGTLANLSGTNTNSLGAGYSVNLYLSFGSDSFTTTNEHDGPNGYHVFVTPDLAIPSVAQVTKIRATGSAVLSGTAVTNITLTNAGQGYDPSAPPAVTFTPAGAVAAAIVDPETGSITGFKISSGGNYVTRPVVSIANPPTYQTQRTGGTLYGYNPATGKYNYTFNSGDAVPYQTTIKNNLLGEGTLQSRPMKTSAADKFRLKTVLTVDPVYRHSSVTSTNTTTATGNSDDFLIFEQDCFGDMAGYPQDLTEVRTVKTYNTPGPLPVYGVPDGAPVYGARDYQPLPDDGYLDIGEQVQIGYDVLMPNNYSGIYFVASKVDALDEIAEPIGYVPGRESPPLDATALVNNNTFISDIATRVQILSGPAPKIDIASQVTASSGLPIVQSDGFSDMASVDEQGKYVVFESYATDLAVPQTTAAALYGTSITNTPPTWETDASSSNTNASATTGVANGLKQIFRRNTATRSIEIVSVSSGGAQANADARNASVNTNGLQIAFESTAPNLVDYDTGGNSDIFVRRYDNYRTIRVSVQASGVQGNAGSFSPSISGSGRFVAFASVATNLDPAEIRASGDVSQKIYVHDRGVSGNGAFDEVANIATYAVSINSSGNLADGWCDQPKISEDGNYITFVSYSSNLPQTAGGSAIGASGYQGVVYRVKLNNGKPDKTSVEAVSVSTSGALADALSYEPAINGDGSQIAFTSMAGNLVAGDGNGFADVFVRDFTRSKTVRVSESLNRFAIGSISFPSSPPTIPQTSPDNNPSDGDKITLGDGTKLVTFNFTSAPVVLGPTAYDVLIGETASESRDNLVAVINAANAAGNLGIRALANSPDNANPFYPPSDEPSTLPGEALDPSLYLVCTSPGTQGNIPIGGNFEPGDSVNGFNIGTFPSGSFILTTGMARGGTEATDDAGELDGVPAGSTMPSIDRTGMVVAFRSTMQTLDVYDRSLNGLNGLRKGDVMRMLLYPSANIYVRERDTDGGSAGSKLPDAVDNVNTKRVSVNKFGYRTQALANVPSSANSHKPSLSANGRYVAFSSDSENNGGLVFGRTNLDPQDTNGYRDVFVQDRNTATEPPPIVTNNPPDIIITEPSWLNGQELSVGSTITINALVTDVEDGSIPLKNVIFYVNGVEVKATNRYGNYYSATHKIRTISPSNVIIARATDSSGEANSSAASEPLTFASVSAITQPTSVTMLELPRGTILQVGQPVELSARVSLPANWWLDPYVVYSSLSAVRFYANGVLIGSAPVDTGTTGTTSTITWYPPTAAQGVVFQAAVSITRVYPFDVDAFSTLYSNELPQADILGVDQSAVDGSPQKKVEDVFQTVLSRVPDGVENNYWVTAIGEGATQADMVLQLIQEDEYKNLQNKLFGYYYKMGVAPNDVTFLNGIRLMEASPSLSAAPAGYPSLNGLPAPYGATIGDAAAAQEIVSSSAFATVNPNVQTMLNQDFMLWYFGKWGGPMNQNSSQSLSAAMAQYSPSTAAKGYAASFINALYYVYPNASADVTAFDYQLKATSLQWLYTGVWSTPTQPPVTDQAQLDAFVQNLLAKERLAGSTVPILSASKSVSGFVASQGVASAAKMLYVSAANVVGNVVVEVPAGFEASTDGINFQPSVAVVPVAGQLLSAPVYVRLSSFATAGAIQGTAVVSASGVSSRLVALSAQVSGNAFERVADTYTGIFGSGILDSFFVAKNGLFSLTTQTDGSFSGSVSVGGAKYAFTGLFTDPGQPITVSVPRKKQTPITLALDFDTQRPTHRITGTVTIDSSVSTLVALPKIFTGAPGAIHPKSGKRYNIVLPAADPTLAHGFAMLSVAANGAVSFTGRLGDGTAFSAPTVAIDGDNDEIPGYWIVPAYAAPYGAGGCLVGEFYIAKNEAAVQPDVSGNFGWVRPASSRAKLFPAGFRYALSPLGQAYAVTPNVSLISGSGATAPFTLKFDQSAKVLASPLGQIGSWPASNVPALVAPVQSGLTFAFMGSTGAFSGALKITPTSKKATLFDGLMLSQKIQLPGSLTPIYGVGIMAGPTGVAELEIGD